MKDVWLFTPTNRVLVVKMPDFMPNKFPITDEQYDKTIKSFNDVQVSMSSSTKTRSEMKAYIDYDDHPDLGGKQVVKDADNNCIINMTSLVGKMVTSVIRDENDRIVLTLTEDDDGK